MKYGHTEVAQESYHTRDFGDMNMHLRDLRSSFCEQLNELSTA